MCLYIIPYVIIFTINHNLISRNVLLKITYNSEITHPYLHVVSATEGKLVNISILIPHPPQSFYFMYN